MDEKLLAEYLGGILYELRAIRFALTGEEDVELSRQIGANQSQADQEILAGIIADMNNR